MRTTDADVRSSPSYCTVQWSSKGETPCRCRLRPTPRVPKYLRDKYAIVGVGETTYTRGSGMTTRALGTWAVRNAIEDAGLKASDIDGMLSYQSGDSTFSTFIAGDLGLRLNFYMDVFGGGSSTEALVGMAMGLIEAGMCKTVVIFRAMNGFSQVRIGGTGARAAAPVVGRRAAQARLRLAERRPDVRADLHAPHVRLRHAARAGRAPSRRSTASTPRTTPRPSTRSASPSTTC